MAEDAQGFLRSKNIWEQKSTVGAPRIFATPNDMREGAAEYFRWAIDNPLYSAEWKTEDKQLKAVSLPVPRPFTVKEMCIFWGVSNSYFRNFELRLKNITEGERLFDMKEEFFAVIENIESVIYTQKFNGAAAGFFNANIISRDLGLAEKSEIKANVYGSDVPIIFK